MLVVVAITLVAGCSTPATGSGTLTEARHRIVDLVNETAQQIGSPVAFKALAVSKTDPVPCRKHFLGYTISRLATHRAEVTDPMAFTGGDDGASLLPRVEAYWRSRGYTVDRSGLSDQHYPKLRAHVGDDLLVATGYVGVHQINVYGVTPCVR
ncbi:MAG TPA: hypothetical protein VH914_14905 [Acidimicrobiia bacterium]|nr:hypothetical protein [Acidimicrobiia bacterium]